MSHRNQGFPRRKPWPKPEASSGGEGGSLGTDPRPSRKVVGDKSWENPNSACWLGVSPRFQETSWEVARPDHDPVLPS